MLTYSISKYYAVTRQKRRTRRCFPPCSRIRHSKKGKRIRRTSLMANTPPYDQPQNGQPASAAAGAKLQSATAGRASIRTAATHAVRPAAAIRTTATLWTASAADAAVWSAAADAVRSARHAPAHRVSTGGSTACDATICPIATIRSAATANARQLSFPASRRRGQK